VGERKEAKYPFESKKGTKLIFNPKDKSKK
jgi:hypothetical protein